MDLRDAERQRQRAEMKLCKMKQARGDHDEFANLTTEFLERTQFGFESAVDNWGDHAGNKPDDQIIQWLFEIVNDDRHHSQPTVSHADVAVSRSPTDFSENVDVIMDLRDGDHAYFFPHDTDQEPIPPKYRKIRVTETCEIILEKLETKIEMNAEGDNIEPNDPLANQDQRDDHPR